MKRHYCMMFFALMSSAIMQAQIKLPAIFSDNMVVQQNSKVNIWGKAQPNEKITIIPSWGKKIKAQAATDGVWRAVIQTGTAATNQKITLKGKNKIIIHNILVGEVWLCSGQSNMEFPIHKTTGWRTGILNEKEEMQDADYPQIRLFHVTHQLAPNAPVDSCQGNWVVCNAKNLEDFSAVGFVFGRRLFKELNQPIGLIQSTWGGTPAEAWTSMTVMKNNPLYANVIQDFAPKNIKREKDWCKIPSTLWNGMINPILPYTIKGVIWYQGESNADRYESYQQVFTNMIDDWRLQWKQPQLPFYFVQIAPQSHQPAGIREAQLETWLTVPNTGMAVITDAGDSTDIHPRNKEITGNRLASWALNQQYGKNIACASPYYSSMKIQGDSIIISFKNADNGLTCKEDTLSGFLISGNDKRFYAASASIKGSQVIVYSGRVKNPTAVRYAYLNWFHANLYNKEGLPCSPFRTDKFVEKSYAAKFADSEINRFPKAWMLDYGKAPYWGYSQGVSCLAMLRLAQATGDKSYFDYVEQWADGLIDNNGDIEKYKKDSYNLDFINSGKVLFDLYKETHKEKYHKAMLVLIDQLNTQPRTVDGGFWHKKVYTNQMWLDGIYMASPFMAQYGYEARAPRWTAEAIKQISLCHKHTYDTKTGLYYHACDVSKKADWAEMTTGHSPNFWGRSIGWYYMAMVDALDYIPVGMQGRDSIVTWVKDLTATLIKYQDKNGLWSQIIDQPGYKDNYEEASVSSQCMYAMAKAVNRGYVDLKYRANAEKAWKGITTKLIRVNLDGTLSLTKCCAVAGLGGKPFRDGSFEYYVHERIRDNDAKATGPFIMGCLELNK